VPGGPPCLFDHVKLPVRDLARSRAFYERALQPFAVRVVQSSQGPGFAIDDRGDFWIMEQEMAAGSVHIAFAAPDRETVDAFHAAAVKAGGGRQRTAWAATSLSLRVLRRIRPRPPWLTKNIDTTATRALPADRRRWPRNPPASYGPPVCVQ
jgi:catechol 2,3-dioxygenase-like lactoylglutathione lyase family enzyme